MIDIPKALRLIRALHGWDQSELARRAQIHPTAISRMEKGIRKPNIDSVDRIARAAGLPFEILAALARKSDDPKFNEAAEKRFMDWVTTYEPKQQ